MALAERKEYTLDDIYALPEGVRAELIDGQIYYMAPPSANHQKVLASLVRQIGNHIEKSAGECEVYPAPFAVYLNEDDVKYVEPDISVICDKNKVNQGGCKGAPDWVIEIVSPGSVRMDYYTKLFKYRSAKVKEYWIVDYEKKLISVYDFQNENLERYDIPGEVPVNLYSGELKIVFNEI